VCVRLLRGGGFVSVGVVRERKTRDVLEEESKFERGEASLARTRAMIVIGMRASFRLV
jgi:hypothetical protein